MDVQPEPAAPDPSAPGPPAAAGTRGADRDLLQALARELGKPVVAMRAEVGRILADEAGGPGSGPRGDSARELLGLCDDLLGMTRAWATTPSVDGEADETPGTPAGA